MAKNVRIKADNLNETGFDIYLDFSGKKEYLMHHKRNYYLWQKLKDAPYLNDVRREWISGKMLVGNPANKNPRMVRNRRSHMEKLDNTVSHVMLVVDDYIEYE